MNQKNLCSDEGSTKLLAALYHNIIKTLLETNVGHKVDEDTFLRILRMIINLLIETQPQLNSADKEYLGEILQKATKIGVDIPEFSSILSEVDELRIDLSGIESKEPISALVKEKEDLLSMDKTALMDEIISLRKQVARLEANNDVPEDPVMSSDVMCYLRDRSGRTLSNRTSDIDLREVNKRERGENTPENSLVNNNGKWESTSSNSILQDFILVIKSMSDIDMFVEYDPTIQSPDDFSRQKKAKLSSVMKAFGDAVNVRGLDKSYNNNIQKARDNKTRKYDLTIFDALKKIADYYLNQRPIK